MKNYKKAPSWESLEASWLENYEEANYDKSLSSSVLTRTHSIIEKDKRLKSRYNKVLELGVGTMAHFSHVTHDYDTYIASDHDPKVIKFLQKNEWPSAVEVLELKGNKLPFEDDSIDRVIATHVLEHIPHPVQALEEWTRVLKPGGVLSLILPCDPGWAWRLGRHFGPRSDGEKAGLPYDYYMACEHINSIFNLKEIVKFHYPDREEWYWPLKVPLPDINLIYAVNCYV
jgi:ubiquinone/menaquinone biosynthesis C-methylase UbiE